MTTRARILIKSSLGADNGFTVYIDQVNLSKMRKQRRQVDIVAVASAEQGHTTAAVGTRCQQSCCQMFTVTLVKQPVVASSFICVAFVRGHRRRNALGGSRRRCGPHRSGWDSLSPRHLRA